MQNYDSSPIPNKRIDTCMDYTRPQLAIALDQIRNALVDAKRSRRGVKFRYLTEITSENISFCKVIGIHC